MFDQYKQLLTESLHSPFRSVGTCNTISMFKVGHPLLMKLYYIMLHLYACMKAINQ